jgi:hypothetical protein
MSSKNQNSVLSIVRQVAISTDVKCPSIHNTIKELNLTVRDRCNIRAMLVEKFDIIIDPIVVDHWFSVKDIVLTVDLIIAGENPLWCE